MLGQTKGEENMKPSWRFYDRDVFSRGRGAHPAAAAAAGKSLPSNCTSALLKVSKVKVKWL